MSTAYHHSVSNRLLLDFRDSALHYSICSQSYQPLLCGIFELIDETILNNLLEDNQLFNNIYASVQLISSTDPFTLIPAEIDDADEQEMVFLVNHKLNQGDILQSSLISEHIALIHRLPIYLYESISAKLPVCTFSHCSEWFYRWITGNSKTNDPQIFYQVDQKYLRIAAFNGGELLILNQQYLSSDDELFFEVMALIEQLDLDIEKLHLHPVASNDRSALFENYVAHLHPSALKPQLCNGEAVSASLALRMTCG